MHEIGIDNVLAWEKSRSEIINNLKISSDKEIVNLDICKIIYSLSLIQDSYSRELAAKFLAAYHVRLKENLTEALAVASAIHELPFKYLPPQNFSPERYAQNNDGPEYLIHAYYTYPDYRTYYQEQIIAALQKLPSAKCHLKIKELSAYFFTLDFNLKRAMHPHLQKNRAFTLQLEQDLCAEAANAWMEPFIFYLIVKPEALALSKENGLTIAKLITRLTDDIFNDLILKMTNHYCLPKELHTDLSKLANASYGFYRKEAAALADSCAQVTGGKAIRKKLEAASDEIQQKKSTSTLKKFVSNTSTYETILSTYLTKLSHPIYTKPTISPEIIKQLQIDEEQRLLLIQQNAEKQLELMKKLTGGESELFDNRMRK